MSLSSSLNRWLDRLPRTRFGLRSRELAAYEACGVVGYVLAVLATAALHLARAGSLFVVLVLASVCAASFFAWIELRRRLSGAVTIVLLEHVWIALACSVGVLRAAGVPPLRALDALCVGIAVFLAAGRVGCFLVGCCHGRPAHVGVCYGDEHVRDGFPAHRAGVRLFPVQAVEGAALAGIAAVGAALALGGTPGAGVAWFLGAYAIARFGIEGLRGDHRPHWFGLSQSRWMCLGEMLVACALSQRSAGETSARALGVFLVALGGAAAVVGAALRRRGLPLALLSDAHVGELRALARELTEDAAGGEALRARTSSLGVSIAASRSAERPGRVHVSIALPRGAHDLAALCELGAAAFPEAAAEDVALAPETLLHLVVQAPLAETPDRRAVAIAWERSLLQRAEDGAAAPGRDAYFHPQPKRPRAPAV